MMVRRTILAVIGFAVFSSCTTTRIAVPSVSPSPVEIRFAGGLLRTVSPGPDWTVRADAVVMGDDGSRTKYQLVFIRPSTNSMIGAIVYPSPVASPAMMADRLRTGMEQGGGEPGGVDFSAEDGGRASFRFKLVAIGADVGDGKAVVIRLNESVSVVVIGTWLKASPEDESAMNAVIAGLGVASSPK